MHHTHDSVTAYDVRLAERFRIPCSLTIVDKQTYYGDIKGLERDQEIAEIVLIFFEDTMASFNLIPNSTLFATIDINPIFVFFRISYPQNYLSTRTNFSSHRWFFT